ncbi:MAG: lipid-A-disaccharide synthase N-terminal domain-containing protein [Phycisphaerales bacterium]
MKIGPALAMVGLILVGVWLVLQPTLARKNSDFSIRIGAVQLNVREYDDGTYEFVSPQSVASLGRLDGDRFAQVLSEQREKWNARPAFERTLMGFFNITEWTNLTWVLLGLAGQSAFFFRMFIQWVVSEKRGRSEVPEIFWWFSLAGGVMMFSYFVWRVDFVGVIGQSSGVVIYARNLRLIHKQRRREQRRTLISADPEPGETRFPARTDAG